MPLWIVNIIVLGIAGFFGEKTLTSVGGLMLLFTFAVMIGRHAFSIWGIVFWLVALFIGFVIANIRTAVKETKQEKK